MAKFLVKVYAGLDKVQPPIMERVYSGRAMTQETALAAIGRYVQLEGFNQPSECLVTSEVYKPTLLDTFSESHRDNLRIKYLDNFDKL